MLTLLSPKRLLSGYLAGAFVTSVTCGLILVFTLNDSGSSSSAKHTVDPVLNLVVGAIILLVAFVVGTGRDKRRRARKARKLEQNKDKPPPRWKRQLSKGSARDTFLVGILLSFPGASYIAGMDLLSKQGTGTATTSTLGFGVHTEAVHDRLDVDVLDLDVRSDPAHTPIVHVTCIDRVLLRQPDVGLSMTPSASSASSASSDRCRRSASTARVCSANRGAGPRTPIGDRLDRNGAPARAPPARPR